MRLFIYNSGTHITIILVAPILFTIFAYPNTFSLSWNQGRGGFLFAMAFIAAELIGINQKISRKKFFVVIALAALTIGYFIALSLGLRDAIVTAGQYYKVQIIDSWIWMWDFIVMAIYVSCSLVILLGKRWYKFASAGAIYLAGSAIILSLDAFFPYDTLGPLQSIVPLYLQINQYVIGFINNHIINVGARNSGYCEWQSAFIEWFTRTIRFEGFLAICRSTEYDNLQPSNACVPS